MPIPDRIYKQREGNYLKFDVAHDASTIFTFMLKRRKSDATPLIEVNDGAIVKFGGTHVLVPLTPSMLDIAPGDYFGEIKSKFSDVDIDKSDDIIIRIEQSVFHDG